MGAVLRIAHRGAAARRSGIGDPLEAKTLVGPLIDKASFEGMQKALQAAKAEQIKRVTETQYHDLAHTRQLIDANLSKEKHLQEMIAEAKKRVTAKKALAKVPPVGSGV